MNHPEVRVSIIVNSYNPKGDARIRAMTEFALRCYHTYTAIPHELLLVDGHNHTDPKLNAVCDELGYHYVNLGRSLSFAEGYNTGLVRARAPWLVLAANDILVVAGWLEKLLAAAEKTGAWMTAPFLSNSDYPAQRLDYVVSNRAFIPNYLTLNLNLLTRRCVDVVGLIDEQFTGCFNDVDYVLRIRAAGGEIVLTPCGPITHLGSATLTSPALRSMYEHDHPLFEAKWPGVWDTDALRLRRRDGPLGVLDALTRHIPRRWRSDLRRLIYRIEPLLAPKSPQKFPG
jgi:GT2 family glycosyltransferase